MIDYYKDLKLNYDATEKEIKNAYRSQAKKYHPDLNQGDAQAALKFKRVTKAYDVLMDENLRDEHDIALQASGVVFTHLKEEDCVGSTSATKSTDPTKPKKPVIKTKAQVRAERRAAAMRKVQEAKKFMRKVIITGVSIVLIAVICLSALIYNSCKVVYVNVTFDYCYASIDNQTIKTEQDKTIEMPEYPVRDGYDFDGWYTEKEYTTKWNFDEDVAKKSLTLYAKWKIETQYTEFDVELDYNGADGNNSTAFVTVIENRYTTIDVVPTKTGYDFAGWCTDEKLENLIQRVGGSATNFAWKLSHTKVYAKWTVKMSKVEFVLEDGKVDAITKDLKYTSEVNSVIIDPSIFAQFRDSEGFYTYGTDGTDGEMIINSAGKLVVDLTKEKYYNLVFNEDSVITLYAKWPEEDGDN